MLEGKVHLRSLDEGRADCAKGTYAVGVLTLCHAITVRSTPHRAETLGVHRAQFASLQVCINNIFHKLPLSNALLCATPTATSRKYSDLSPSPARVSSIHYRDALPTCCLNARVSSVHRRGVLTRARQLPHTLSLTHMLEHRTGLFSIPLVAKSVWCPTMA
jgi:hypothetical protein